MAYAKYTTVGASQTRAEIERLLDKHHAKQYGTAVDYDKQEARVQFKLADRLVLFKVRLPAVTGPARGREDRQAQAERQRWRALLLVIKAKLEAIESKIETFEEAFLSHIIMPNGATIGDMAIPVIGEAYRTGIMPKQPLGLPPAPEEEHAR